MKNQTFTASIWQEDDWFIAQCLEVDIASQGETEEAALDNLTEALELYFEPPQPSLKTNNPEVRGKSQCRLNHSHSDVKEVTYAVCC